MTKRQEVMFFEQGYSGILQVQGVSGTDLIEIAAADTDAVLVVSDAVVLSNLVDGTLIVFGYGSYKNYYGLDEKKNGERK